MLRCTIPSMPPLSTCRVCKKRIMWLYNSAMWVWPSYHQWLIHTSNSQPSGDIAIVYTWLKYSNYYIIGIYMTFRSNDIHDIYNKDQRPKQYHDSFQQLSYIIYDLHHKHLQQTSRTKTYICPSLVCKICQCNFNIINLWLCMLHIDINSSSWPYQDQLAIFFIRKIIYL